MAFRTASHDRIESDTFRLKRFAAAAAAVLLLAIVAPSRPKPAQTQYLVRAIVPVPFSTVGLVELIYDIHRYTAPVPGTLSKRAK